VLDFRDEWGISSRFWENRPRDALSRGLQRRMQARVLRRAQAVLATTTRSEAELAAACRAAGSRARTACVYNGYDPADFGDRPARREPRTAYRLAYVGTLWALTDVRPLVGGMALLAREHPGAAARLELVIAGRRTPEQDEALRAAALRPGRVTTLDYLDHSEAVRLVQGADGLCLLLANAPDAARVMPAKLFEYMAARRPILAVVPPGEVRDLLEGHPAALVCDPGDPPSIAEALRREIARHESGLEPEWGGFDPSRYSRISQTGQLAGLLHDVVDSWRRRPSA
jgi:glycosyltransferase involved in cell wall biosynthesis